MKPKLEKVHYLGALVASVEATRGYRFWVDAPKPEPKKVLTEEDFARIEKARLKREQKNKI